MSEMKIYLTAPPELAAEASKSGPVCAMSHRVGRDLRLYRSPMPGARAELIFVDLSAFNGCGPHRTLAMELAGECRRAGCEGMCLDLPPRNQRLAAFCASVAEESDRFGLRLYLPERYAGAAPSSKLLIPAQNTSGSYESRLKRLSDLYGPDRIALSLSRACSEYTLPCPTGIGCPVSPGSLPPSRRFYSPRLKANYMTYIKNGRLRLALWDDPRTLTEKLLTAQSLHIPEAFLPYPRK